jgi:hypothetical protein
MLVLAETWRPGDKVRTKPTVRPRRYAARKGTVAELRRLDPSTIEVGVVIGGRVSWFAPGELEAP